MSADPLLVLGAAALVAALALDEVAVGQFMLSQPLVGGWIVGWALGDPGGGLLAGAFFQFLCLTELPVGSSVPADGVLAGLVGAAAFVLLPAPAGWDDAAVLGLLALGFLPLAHAARAADIRVRRVNRRWAPAAERLVREGRLGRAQLAALGGLPLFFLRAFLVALPALGLLAAWGGRGLEGADRLAAALGLFGRSVPLIGLAALVAQRRRSGWPAALAAGAAAGIVIGRVAG